MWSLKVCESTSRQRVSNKQYQFSSDCIFELTLILLISTTLKFSCDRYRMKHLVTLVLRFSRCKVDGIDFRFQTTYQHLVRKIHDKCCQFILWIQIYLILTALTKLLCKSFDKKSYQDDRVSSINHVTPNSRLTLPPRDVFVTFLLLFLPTNQNAFWPI